MPKLIPAPPIEVHDDGVHCGPCTWARYTRWQDKWYCGKFLNDGLAEYQLIEPTERGWLHGMYLRCAPCLAQDKFKEEKKK